MTLNLRWYYADALYKDPAPRLDDIREALTMLEETERIARRVLGGASDHDRELSTTTESSSKRAAAAEERTQRSAPSETPSTRVRGRLSF